MDIKISYDKRFTRKINEIRDKYGNDILRLDGIGLEQLDICNFSKKFFNSNVVADSSVDANSNVKSSNVITYTKEVPKPLLKLDSYHVLWKQLQKEHGTYTANKMLEESISGGLYINDMHGISSAKSYCFGFSCYDIMINGLVFESGIYSEAPKHLFSYKSQIEQFVGFASNSVMGAVGLADLLLVMSYYVEKALKEKEISHIKLYTEENVWTAVKEELTSLVYTLNQSGHRIGESPFTNVSIYDKYFLEKLQDNYIFPDGSKFNIEVVNKLQELFLNVLVEIMDRTLYTFPIITLCLAKREDGLFDDDFLGMVCSKNLKYGQFNFYGGDTFTVSSCCRLRGSSNHEYFNSFGAGSSKIGSIGVITIDLPRIAVLSNGDVDKFMKLLSEAVLLGGKINNAKRNIVKRKIDDGYLPLYTHGFMELEKQYSTTGVNGFYECIEILGKNIINEDGQELGLKIMDLFNKLNKKMDKLYKFPHNVEQVPAENVSVKLAEKDRILGYNKEYVLYSNQFIPLINKADMLDRIKLQGIFDKHFSGGAIAHINIEERIEDVDKMIDLVKYCINNGVIYFAVNYNLAMCENGDVSVTRSENCPSCGGKITDNFSRVVGFLTNTKGWIKERREYDYPNRIFY